MQHGAIWSVWSSLSTGSTPALHVLKTDRLVDPKCKDHVTHKSICSLFFWLLSTACVCACMYACLCVDKLPLETGLVRTLTGPDNLKMILGVKSLFLLSGLQ